jgi:hypothetical protein
VCYPRCVIPPRLNRALLVTYWPEGIDPGWLGH